MRSAVVFSGFLMTVLLGAGVLVTLTSDPGSVGRDLGPEALGGAIVGASLVIVQSVLSAAAERRNQHRALVTMLSATVDLNGIDLAGRALVGIYLPGRALVAARLAGSDLTAAKLYYGDLRHADLVGANLTGVDLSGATLAGANLRDATLRKAVLRDVDLTGADLTGADLSGAVIEDANLTGVTTNGADFTGAVIRSTILNGADLSRAVLATAQLDANRHDASTQWPPDFEPPPSRVVPQEPIAGIGLADYLSLRARRVARPVSRQAPDTADDGQMSSPGEI